MPCMPSETPDSDDERLLRLSEQTHTHRRQTSIVTPAGIAAKYSPSDTDDEGEATEKDLTSSPAKLSPMATVRPSLPLWRVTQPEGVGIRRTSRLTPSPTKTAQSSPADMMSLLQELQMQVRHLTLKLANAEAEITQLQIDIHTDEPRRVEETAKTGAEVKMP